MPARKPEPAVLASGMISLLSHRRFIRGEPAQDH